MPGKGAFRSVFVRNEYHALKGRYNSTVAYLFAVLFIAFMAFGFSTGAFNHQRELAADPYSNWINLDFHSGTRDSLRSLNERISDGSFRDRFHIRGSYFYNKGMVPVLTFSGGTSIVHYEARTIEPGSGIVKDLLRSGVCAKYFPDSVENVFTWEPNGIIISRKMAEDTGLDPRTLSFIQVRSPAGDLVPVPVLAVVNELPDLSDIVYTSLFYCKTMNAGWYDRDNIYYRIFIEDLDTSGILRVLKEIYVALEIRDPATVQTTVLQTGNRSVLNWKIEIGTQEKEIPVKLKESRIASLASLKNHHFGRYYELSKDTSCDDFSFYHDYLAIEFNNLEKIRDFSTCLRENFSLQLNMEVLNDRENYLYTGNLAIGAIILLMVLSTLSVSVYVSGIIRNHLLKIKRNLGNFLAFGVKNNTLVLLYIMVTVKILAAALIPATLLAYACGEFFEKHLLGALLAMDPEKDYFSLVNSWFLFFILLILVVTVSRTWYSVGRILKHTPGDLVYERDD